MEKKIQQLNHVDEFFFQLYLCVESNGVKIMNIVNVFNLTIDAINKVERKIIQKKFKLLLLFIWSRPFFSNSAFAIYCYLNSYFKVCGSAIEEIGNWESIWWNKIKLTKNEIFNRLKNTHCCCFCTSSTFLILQLNYCLQFHVCLGQQMIFHRDIFEEFMRN